MILMTIHRPFHVEIKDALFNQPNISALLTDIGLLANKMAFWCQWPTVCSSLVSHPFCAGHTRYPTPPSWWTTALLPPWSWQLLMRTCRETCRARVVCFQIKVRKNVTDVWGVLKESRPTWYFLLNLIAFLISFTFTFNYINITIILIILILCITGRMFLLG